VRIDKTPPEIAFRCALPGTSPFITGRDGLSGIASAIQTGNTAVQLGEFKNEQSYAILDRAGNRLDATFAVKAEGHEARFALLRLTYNGTALAVSANVLKCEGGGGNLEQKLELPGTEVQAKFDAERNETRITVKTGSTVQRLTRPGQVFLNASTNQGSLGFEF
jgi:hypothetical protein